VIAVWNYAPPEHAGLAKTVNTQIQRNQRRTMRRLQESTPNIGDVHSLYGANGKAGSILRRSKSWALKKSAQLSLPESSEVKESRIDR